MRSSNIELCRIAAILLVIISHSASWTLGSVSSLDECYVPSLFMRGISVIGVDVFVFISGWFGINYKRSSIINILFIVFFWGIVRAAILCVQGNLVWRNFFLISDTNWFIVSYLGLVLFSPLINVFFDNVKKESIRLFLILFFVYQTWFGWFPALPLFDTFQSGYSFISFIFIYMIARYMKQYGVPVILKNHGGLIYLIISLFLGFVAYVSVRYHFPIVGFLFKYNNPLVIISAVAFFMFFANISMPNINWINYIASSTLSVLLIHEPYPAHAIIKKQFLWLRDSTMVVGGPNVLIFWIISVIFVFIACLLLDQIRIILYRPIKKSLNNKKNNE